jgi:hypothetical protein
MNARCQEFSSENCIPRRWHQLIWTLHLVLRKIAHRGLPCLFKIANGLFATLHVWAFRGTRTVCIAAGVGTDGSERRIAGPGTIVAFKILHSAQLAIAFCEAVDWPLTPLQGLWFCYGWVSRIEPVMGIIKWRNQIIFRLDSFNLHDAGTNK